MAGLSEGQLVGVSEEDLGSKWDVVPMMMMMMTARDMKMVVREEEEEQNRKRI